MGKPGESLSETLDKIRKSLGVEDVEDTTLILSLTGWKIGKEYIEGISSAERYRISSFVRLSSS